MRTGIVILAVLAGLAGVSVGAARAEVENLSCITGLSPSEQRLLRDCAPKREEPQYVVIEVVEEGPSPSTPPAMVKHGESGKGDGFRGRDHNRDAPAGRGDPGRRR